MIGGIETGLNHALWLLGYLIGLAPALVVLGLTIGIAVPLAEWIAHRSRVWRIRRDARRDGRLSLTAQELRAVYTQDG